MRGLVAHHAQQEVAEPLGHHFRQRVGQGPADHRPVADQLEVGVVDLGVDQFRPHQDRHEARRLHEQVAQAPHLGRQRLVDGGDLQRPPE